MTKDLTKEGAEFLVGEELDKLVQERCLGLCAHRQTEWYCVEDDDTGFTCKKCGIDIYGNRVPKYSMEIGATWILIQHYGMCIGPMPDGEDEVFGLQPYPPGTWYVGAFDFCGRKEFVYRPGSEIALAVCIMALQIVKTAPEDEVVWLVL